MIFVKNTISVKNVDFFLKLFVEFYRFSLYPKKLSYSSSNAYIKKIRVWELGKPTCLLKNLKNA